jgi:hypothetical protein
MWLEGSLPLSGVVRALAAYRLGHVLRHGRLYRPEEAPVRIRHTKCDLSVMIASQIREAQAYGQQRTAELGIDPADVPARVQEFLKGTVPGKQT